jgi:hypothetical protein
VCLRGAKLKEEVIASTLDGDRLWRRVPGVPGVPDCV